MKTFAGSSFMTVFNGWYYSWSPPVAASIAPDPYAKAAVRVVLQPLLGILELAAASFSTFSFSGEVGIVVAGLVAASLIGLVYLAPVASLAAVAACRRRGSVPSSRGVGLLAIPWAASLALIAVSECAASQPMMMAATASFVLFTIAVVVAAVSLGVVRCLYRWCR